MNEYEWLLSISIAQHDASITLLHNGELVLYIPEERISRDKHDSGVPLTCLSLVKKYTNRIDKLLFCNTPDKIVHSIIDHLMKTGMKFPSNDPELVFQRWTSDIREFNTVNDDFHHNHHAACGFYFSPFDEAICLVMDGWGACKSLLYSMEDFRLPEYNDISPDETTSIYHMLRDRAPILLKKYCVYDPYRTNGLHEIMDRQARGKVNNNHFPFRKVSDFFSMKRKVSVSEHLDIGVMYGVVSTFLGYGELECGKTMGLSSFGEEDDSLPPLFVSEDSILCNKNLFSQSRILNEDAYPMLKTLNDSFQKKANMAYAIQKGLEKVFIERVRFIDENYECKNIVLSGGCALNVVGNSVLTEKFPHMNFFVDPIANDAGQSLGHAIAYYTRTNGEINYRPKNCYLGPEYSKDELREKIEEYVKTSGQISFREPWSEEDRI